MVRISLTTVACDICASSRCLHRTKIVRKAHYLTLYVAAVVIGFKTCFKILLVSYTTILFKLYLDQQIVSLTCHRYLACVTEIVMSTSAIRGQGYACTCKEEDDVHSRLT